MLNTEQRVSLSHYVGWNRDSQHGGVVAATCSSANYSCILRDQERPSKDDIDRMANNAEKYKAESEAVATRLAFQQRPRIIVILNDAKKYKAEK
ncbi:hypothetical protein Pst134EA_032664 [Puccinia striiformis f. sp. tritici]|uniref:uncharacterized protein n=1 Tax=Puccinia striiformis f. sp. tritici TaxID=168172 RepID=UPI002008E888|nr:uncharacterized protein Pst134EA_032664 [Puccinia striiformis f. sp. tritici]KAH9443474.1 hypothetical protein Pst134EA_032664 [Puccinia striiformis f. sp. tritici]